MKKLIFFVFMFSCFHVFMFFSSAFAQEEELKYDWSGPVTNIGETTDLEEYIEESIEPHRLKQKDDEWYCNLPLIGSLFCSSRDVHRFVIPQSVQVAVPTPSEDLVSPSPSAHSEGEEVKTQVSSPINWLREIMRLIGGGSGHLEVFWPDQLRNTRSDLGEMRATREIEGIEGIIVDDVRETQKALWPHILQEERPVDYIPPIDDIPSDMPEFPRLPDDSPPAASLRDVFDLAETWAEVPWGVIEAVARIEGGHLFNYSDEEIQKYSWPGAKDPINCRPNICSAAGPMQLTTGKENADCAKCPKACEYNPNAWAVYKNAVNEAAGERREPDVCNIKDSIFAATKKMKIDSGIPLGEKRDWDKEVVRRVATRYYGECWCCSGGGDWELCKPGREEETFACKRLGMSYCEFVWQYYQSHK